MKEKPIDCIGKCKDAKYLRQLLGSKSDKKKSDKISSKNNKDSNSSEEKKNDSKFVQIAKNKTDYSDDEYKDEDFD